MLLNTSHASEIPFIIQLKQGDNRTFLPPKKFCLTHQMSDLTRNEWLRYLLSSFFSFLCSLRELKALPIASYLANYFLSAKTRLKRETFVLRLKTFLCDMILWQNKERKTRKQKSVNQIRLVAPVMEVNACYSLNLHLPPRSPRTFKISPR